MRDFGRTWVAVALFVTLMAAAFAWMFLLLELCETHPYIGVPLAVFSGITFLTLLSRVDNY